MKKTPLFKRAHVYPAGLRLCGSLFLLMLGGLFLYSCNQDAIFSYIESEPELKDARIKGSPTGIVEFGGKLYVGSDAIYGYNGSGWSSTNPVGGKKVLGLAATTGYLYALIDAGAVLSSAKLYRTNDPASGWGDPVYTGSLNSLFGAGDTLFAGAGSTVKYIDDSMAALSESSAFSGKGRLLGAEYFDSNYFISIENNGVFYATAGDIGAGTASQIEETTSDAANPRVPLTGNFTGFIVIPDGGSDALIMVSTTGTLCKITGTTTGTSSYPPLDATNKWAYTFGFNGAIALYTKDSSQYLLLGSSDSYGYRELASETASLDFGTATLDGPAKSVNDVNAYNSSLGTHPVTSIYQAPNTIDSTMPIFASTSLDGLWSCRNGEWNLEE